MLKKRKTNIIIIGFGNSGSSAVQDLLKEYGNIGKFRYEEPAWSTGEMNHFRLPGMIGDQLSRLTDPEMPDNLHEWLSQMKRPMRIPWRLKLRLLIPDSIYAIYKRNEFTREYAACTIKEIRDQQKYFSSLKKLNEAFRGTPDFEARFQIAKSWLDEVNEIFGRDKDFVLHKPILQECHLDVWPRLFDPFKVLVIFREPYDQMSTLFDHSMSMIFRDMNWKYKTLFGLDKGNRRLFHLLIDTTVMRMRYMDLIESTVGSDRVLKLDFEGLVKNYDVYKSIIERFLGLSPVDHIAKNRYLIPKQSIETINRCLDVLDSSDYVKLAPMKEWYDRNMAIIKDKYLT